MIVNVSASNMSSAAGERGIKVYIGYPVQMSSLVRDKKFNFLEIFFFFDFLVSDAKSSFFSHQEPGNNFWEKAKKRKL